MKGVPQGSILGPLLFVLFMNDLPDFVQDCSIGLYADDIMLYVSHGDPAKLSEIIGKDLYNISRWITSNGLKMNVAKTQLNRRSKDKKVEQIQVSIDGTELNKQSSIKYLGVLIDNDLAWKAHVNHLRQSCMARLAMIRRAGHHLPCHVRKLLYQSFVLPNLDYCSVVWNSCGVVLSNKIERIQNYALRIIFQKPPRRSSAELREAAGWTTLKTRRHNAMFCKVHRCLRSQGPRYLTRKFHTNSNLNYATTRGANKIHLLRPTEYQFLPINIRVHGGTSLQ